MRGVAALLGGAVGDQSDSTAGKIVQLVLVARLAAGAVRNYVRRDTIEPPKWLGGLLAATASKAFVVGLALISLMPSDLMIMLTVGANLETNNQSVAAAIPFIAATVLIAALPLPTFLLFHRRASEVIPKIRDWLNTHNWLINIIVSPSSSC